MSDAQYKPSKDGFSNLETLWLTFGLMAVSAAGGIALAHHLLVEAGLASNGEIASALGPGLLSLIGVGLFIASSWVIYSVVIDS